MSTFPQSPLPAERHLSLLPPLFALDATEAGETFLIRAREEFDLSRRSAANGRRLRLTQGRGEVAEMFRLTGFGQTLPFRDHG